MKRVRPSVDKELRDEIIKYSNAKSFNVGARSMFNTLRDFKAMQDSIVKVKDEEIERLNESLRAARLKSLGELESKNRLKVKNKELSMIIKLVATYSVISTVVFVVTLINLSM